MTDEPRVSLDEVASTEPEYEARRSADSSERAYTTIRKLLVEFRLRPDERINEVQLSRRLGLSRTPIREALNRLSAEGFVSLTPNRGFFVRSLSSDGLIDLYEFRSIIECAAFQRLCERAEQSDLRRLEATCEAVAARDDRQSPDLFLVDDEAFHLQLAELSGNPELVRQLGAINARIRFVRRIQIEHRLHDKTLLDAHSAIAKAAVGRNVDQGVELLRKHIELTVLVTQQALKDVLLRIYVAGHGETRRSRARKGEPSDTQVSPELSTLY